MERSGRHWQIDRQRDVQRDVDTDKDTTSDNTICVEAHLYVWVFFVHSHDFIGEFTTSYRELSRGQNQFNVYEVRHDRSGLLFLSTFDLWRLYNSVWACFDIITPVDWFLKKKRKKRKSLPLQRLLQLFPAWSKSIGNARGDEELQSSLFIALRWRTFCSLPALGISHVISAGNVKGKKSKCLNFNKLQP